MDGSESASETKTSANYKGSAARNTAGPDKVQTISGKIRALFREAVQVLLGRQEDEPQPQRRGKKEGERGGGMMRAARRFAQQLGGRAKLVANAEMRDEFRAAAHTLAQSEEGEDIFKSPGAYLTDQHDIASPFFNNDTAYEFDESFVEQQDYYSLNL